MHEWLTLMVKCREIYTIYIWIVWVYVSFFFLSCLMGCLFCGPNKFEVEQSESFRWILGLGDSFQTSTDVLINYIQVNTPNRML